MVDGMQVVRNIGRAVLGAVVLFVCSTAYAEQQFETPEAAIAALVAAAQDSDTTKLIEILGPKGEEVISSGDEVADRNARASFIAAYDKAHQIELEGDDFAILLIGEDDWPFPIPVVKDEGQWAFDTDLGLDEIIIRRIGRNELSAIESARIYVAAQDRYAALDVDGKSPPAYARRILSKPGQKDGLYWPTEDGETASPLTEKIAEVKAEGYEPGGDTPIPYHGYYFRVLDRQGEGADGGARDYVVDGRMTGGFGLVAHPASYGNSGIMTFMVNQDGVVLEKDLGPETPELVSKMDAFAPDDTWQAARTP